MTLTPNFDRFELQEPAKTHSPAQAGCEAIHARLTSAGVMHEVWQALPRTEQFSQLETMIGDTPLVVIPEIGNGMIASKLEYRNLSGSHYDRAYLTTIRYLESRGHIKPGDELRDITSGSGGISLAVLAYCLGYKARITVPNELPESRLLPMRYFKACVISAGSGYMQATSQFQREEIGDLNNDPSWQRISISDDNQRAKLFTDGDNSLCYLNHSENQLSPDAFSAIGREVVEQATRAPEAAVLAMGNWTTIAGISHEVRRAWPKTKLIGYEGDNRQSHDNYGTSVDNIPLRFRNPARLDEMVIVSNAERDGMDERVNTHRPRQEQIGHSSLMGLVVAEKLGGPTVTIAYDQKIRY
jgi:cysteine synthase